MAGVLAGLAALAGLATAAPPAQAGLPVHPALVVGSSIQMRAGENWSGAVARVEAVDGHLGALRLFQGAPDAGVWRSLGQRDGIISFDLPPADVLTGRYDAGFRAFFAAAPTTRPTWWSYFHEPDVAHSQGHLPDLAAYRAAFAHVAALARATKNPQLLSTLILVGYSGNPQSGESIQDYWPGPALTDVVAWDIYNGWATRRGFYGTMGQIALDRAASGAVRKPWGVAEFGSLVLPNDPGTGRGAWITMLSQYANTNGAQFISYFDSDTYGHGADYRLLDKASQAAYRQVVTRSNT